MRKIYGIGETVLDIIFKEGQPRAAKAGGSVLNSMVSMGRIGLPVSFISEFGLDDLGELIDSFLIDNGVDTTHIYRFKDGKTSLALAFLNNKNDAHYTFYKEFPGKRLDIEFPVAKKDDIVQCGSFYAIWPEIRDKFKSFVRAARENGALIIYDPNFRTSHLNEIDILHPLIIENMQMAGIVRGSDEDFKNIFDANNAEEAWKEVRGYCNCLVYTESSEGVYIRTNSYSGKFPVQKINPVSTIGAGDNFNAGMITAIYQNGITKKSIEEMGEQAWSEVITTAVKFATHVCLSYENYISVDFANGFKHK